MTQDSGLAKFITRRGGTEIVAELPAGNWRTKSVGNAIVLACPEHEPRILRDGKLEILKAGEGS